jgi:hypothetical protein
MTTFTGRLRLADGRQVSYSAQAPAKLLVGWCPPDSTVAQLGPMLAKFPGTKLVRLYSKTTLPSWTSGILPMVGADVTLHVSFKTWPVNVAGWLTSRPTNRRTPFYLTLDHEPEQQDSGDPAPAEYRAEWRELTAALAGHPRRGEVMLTPVYTEYAATRGSRAASWYGDFGVVSGFDGVDTVGFDIYNNSTQAYRTASNMFGFALAHARQHGKPLVVAEWGIERIASDDTGSLCAQRMREHATYFAAQPEARALAWFYRGGDNLDTRAPEKKALTDLIAQYGG